jgi:hypothetical protein
MENGRGRERERERKRKRKRDRENKYRIGDPLKKTSLYAFGHINLKKQSMTILFTDRFLV